MAKTGLQWVRENQAALRPYRNQHVAIHPDRGVVASGDLDVVCDQVEALGLKDEVLLYRVPRVALGRLTLEELGEEWDRRKRGIQLAYAVYWRKASTLPLYRAYCDAWFRFALAGRKWQTPEGEALDMGIGYAFQQQAHALPEWRAYWDAQDHCNEASGAFFHKNLKRLGIKIPRLRK